MSKKTFLILQVEVSLISRSKNQGIPFKHPGEKKWKKDRLYGKHGGKEKKSLSLRNEKCITR